MTEPVDVELTAAERPELSAAVDLLYRTGASQVAFQPVDVELTATTSWIAAVVWLDCRGFQHALGFDPLDGPPRQRRPARLDRRADHRTGRTGRRRRHPPGPPRGADRTMIPIAVASGAVAMSAVVLIVWTDPQLAARRGARLAAVVALALLVASTGAWIRLLVRYELDRHPAVTIDCYATTRATVCTAPKVGP